MSDITTKTDAEKAPVLALKKVDFHSLPDEKCRGSIVDRIGMTIPSGAAIIVGNYNGGVHVSIHNPISDTEQSILTFGLTMEAAAALSSVLWEKVEEHKQGETS